MIINDDILNEYNKLQQEMRDITNRMSEIRGHLLTKGSFSTKNYVCAVSEQTRASMVSLDKVLQVIDEEVLREQNLIQSTTYKIVRVSRKGLE